MCSRACGLDRKSQVSRLRLRDWKVESLETRSRKIKTLSRAYKLVVFSTIVIFLWNVTIIFSTFQFLTYVQLEKSMDNRQKAINTIHFILA